MEYRVSYRDRCGKRRNNVRSTTVAGETFYNRSNAIKHLVKVAIQDDEIENARHDYDLEAVAAVCLGGYTSGWDIRRSDDEIREIFKRYRREDA